MAALEIEEQVRGGLLDEQANVEIVVAATVLA